MLSRGNAIFLTGAGISMLRLLGLLCSRIQARIGQCLIPPEGGSKDVVRKRGTNLK